MKKEFKLSKLFPWILLLGGYVYNIVFFLSKGKSLIDSDMASEMLLSDLLNKQHAIITKDWIYSTEIKVFEGQWFYRIGLLLSPENWLVARTIGTMIGLTVFLLGVMYLAKVLGHKELGVWMAAFLAWPFGFWYFFDVILGTFYIPHCIFIVYPLAITISIAKSIKNGGFNKVIIGIQIALIFVLGIMSGLNGIRQTLIFYAPVFVYAIVVAYLGFRESGLDVIKANASVKMNFAKVSMIGLLGNVMGYGLNIVLFTNRYNYSSFNAMTWGNGSDSILKTIKWYFNSYGLFDFATKNFFSLSGIGAGCGLVLGVLVIISIFRLLMLLRKLDELTQIYVGVMTAVFVVVGAVFTYIWGEEQYWCPLIPLGVIAVFLEIKCDPILKDFEKKVLPVLVMLCVMLSAIGTTKANVATPFRANVGFDGALQFIQEQGYTKGVASFWMSDCVTELTNGNVEMWTMNDEYTETLLWLQANNHREIPEGEFFGLYNINDQEFEDNFEDTFGVEGQKVYEDERYMIYSYEK